MNKCNFCNAHKYIFLSKVPRNIKLITSYETDSKVYQSKCCNSSQIMFQLSSQNMKER